MSVTEPEQLSFFDLPDEEGEPTPLTIQEQFERFHALHPDVYPLLVRFAREVKATGRKQYGIGALFERLRWHTYIEQGVADEHWKLPNNYRSRYARLIMQQEPDLDGFFVLHQLRTK